MPESEMSVVTPNDFMLGNVSRSDIESVRLLLPEEQPGNKINITAAKNAAVMFINIRNIILFFLDNIII